MNRLTKNQIDQLGERLRIGESISDGDLAELQRLGSEYDTALAAVTARLASLQPPLSATSRIKTVQTIVEKLRREQGMRLCQMQDIGGARVVLDGGRCEQDKAVESIVRAFPECRVKDRRGRPSFGYRAVHVTVKQAGYWIEIQVRTKQQDAWAQLVERMGDTYGRQIRYGKPPNEPQIEATRGLTRAELVDLVIGELSEVNGLTEELQQQAEIDAKEVEFLSDEYQRRLASPHDKCPPVRPDGSPDCNECPLGGLKFSLDERGKKLQALEKKREECEARLENLSRRLGVVT